MISRPPNFTKNHVTPWKLFWKISLMPEETTNVRTDPLEHPDLNNIYVSKILLMEKILYQLIW